MKAEEARKLADDALSNLASALKQGKSEALTAYLAAMGRFHHYSFGNVMLIALQKPDATRVAGFRTWKKLGRYVTKGEKGIVIIAPMMIKPMEQDGSEEVDSRNEDRPMLRFKAVYVFDVSQTDGEPLPEFARVGGNPDGHTDRLKVLVTAKGITLEYADTLGGPDGVSCIGIIRLRNGLTPAEEFSVLTHELAHEMLHKSERRKETTRTVRETEAEAVAFVVCQAIGLETGTAAADYIRLYNGDAETLAESLDHIQKTAAEILAVVMNESARDEQ
jgi:antirestriction protein ArdC